MVAKCLLQGRPKGMSRLPPCVFGVECGLHRPLREREWSFLGSPHSSSEERAILRCAFLLEPLQKQECVPVPPRRLEGETTSSVSRTATAREVALGGSLTPVAGFNGTYSQWHSRAEDRAHKLRRCRDVFHGELLPRHLVRDKPLYVLPFDITHGLIPKDWGTSGVVRGVGSYVA